MALIDELNGQMTSDDVKRFKSFCRNNPITPAELEKMNDARDVLTKLEDIGIIGHNSYAFLLDIFQVMNRSPLCHIIKRYQQQMYNVPQQVSPQQEQPPPCKMM